MALSDDLAALSTKIADKASAVAELEAADALKAVRIANQDKRILELVESLAAVNKPKDPNHWEADFATGTVEDWKPATNTGATNRTYRDGRLHIAASKVNDGYTGLGVEVRTSFANLGLPDALEAVLEYTVHFPDDWNPWAGGKLPGLAGIIPSMSVAQVPGGGRPHDGGFSARTMWQRILDNNPDHTRLVSYLYVVSAAGRRIEDNKNPVNGHIYGISALAQVGKVPKYLGRNRDQRHRHYLRCNTVGKSDGVFKVSIDDEVGINLTDVNYRKRPDLPINVLMFDSFYGGPTANKADQSWSIHDVSIEVRKAA